MANRKTYTRLTELQVFKRDNELVDFIKAHRGGESAVTTELICTHLAERGYPTDKRYIGHLINKLMYERNLPLCYINGKGYYWAIRKAEIENTIIDLRCRINAMQEHIDHLNRFIVN